MKLIPSKKRKTEQNTIEAHVDIPVTKTSAIEVIGPKREFSLSLEHVLNEGYFIKWNLGLEGTGALAINSSPLSRYDAWQEYERAKTALEKGQYELKWDYERNMPLLNITRSHGIISVSEVAKRHLVDGSDAFSDLQEVEPMTNLIIDTLNAKIGRDVYDSMNKKRY